VKLGSNTRSITGLLLYIFLRSDNTLVEGKSLTHVYVSSENRRSLVALEMFWCFGCVGVPEPDDIW
jgi:hypothetical protein